MHKFTDAWYNEFKVTKLTVIRARLFVDFLRTFDTVHYERDETNMIWTKHFIGFCFWTTVIQLVWQKKISVSTISYADDRTNKLFYRDT